MKNLFFCSILIVSAGCLNFYCSAQNVFPGSAYSVPIERKSISGNFRGEGTIDTLREVVLSKVDHQEIIYTWNMDYDSLVALTVLSKPVCSLQSHNLKPLLIQTDTWQLFGLSYLKNEGDLNNDGRDELGLVIDWADWSIINTYHLYTYSKKGWKEILNFEIRDTDIDEFKQNGNTKGFIYKDLNGELITRTYDQGDQIDKKLMLDK
ncbi:MAG: hypothetical protein IPH88_10370 [Bacteroidales bacterium]|nr:hypothetical protein [Bacteroidales bacterium]